MKNILLIAAVIAVMSVPAKAADVTQDQTQVQESAKERELDKEIELLKLQEAIREQKAYEERMKEHAEKLDCIICK